MITDITIGSDCEVFVKNKKTGEIISAEGLIQGTKNEPFVFDATNKYFATSLDNVLAEFCIPPVTNKVDFYNYLTKSLKYINKTLGNKFCVAIEQACSLDPKWLQTEHARLFGCEPDYNAYTGMENIKPAADDPYLRSAGGHIHIGYKGIMQQYVEAEYKGKEAKQYIGDAQRCAIAMAMDLHIGVASVIMEPDNKRKQLYGKAGCFRPKEYGLEYRTVSNFYLRERKLVYWVYDAALAAIKWINDGNVIEAGLAQYIQQAINTCDKNIAAELINTFKLKIA